MPVMQIYAKKGLLLEEIKKVTQQMEREIGLGNAEGFVSLVEQRQIIMSQIDSLDQMLQPYDAPLTDDNRVINGKLIQAKENIAALLNDICVIDQRVRGRAEECYGEIKEILKKMGKAKKTANLYGSKTAQVSGYFIEKKK